MDELTEVTELLVSELITNAVLATRALDAPLPFSVRLWLHANRRRALITVWDADPQPPVLQENMDRYAENGRGLMLVDNLSGHWGWYEPPVMGRQVRVVRDSAQPRMLGEVVHAGKRGDRGMHLAHTAHTSLP
jgi:anti-sigma regulatory factor (Ser/Thr protein kinase)